MNCWRLVDPTAGHCGISTECFQEHRQDGSATLVKSSVFAERMCVPGVQGFLSHLSPPGSGLSVTVWLCFV